MSALPTATSPLSVCLQLAQVISRAEHIDHIYDAALDALTTGLSVSRAAILLFDPAGVMRFAAWRGLSDTYRQAVEGHTPWSPQVETAEPIVVSDVTHDASLVAFLPTFRAEKIAAMAFLPLVGRHGVIGKFMLYYPQPHDISPDDLQVARLIAAQVAFAVERWRGHRDLKASEERLRFALDAANMGTWDWDMAAQSVQWSDNVERIHGLPPGTFDGTFQSYEREIHPEDRDRVLASVQRALTEGVPHEVEYRIVGPDGTVRWVEGKGRVQYGPDGLPERMSGVCMNVTPRKHAELARLEASDQSNRMSQRLAAIVESSDDAIVGKTLEGVITSWNRGAERMFGYTLSEVIGRSITIIIPPDRLDEEETVLSRIRAGQPVEMETVRRHKNGSLISISLKISPVKDAGGRIMGASKIARDITARKRSEAERAELQRRLTMLVTASASLLDSPETESVRSATILLARQTLAADAYAVWAYDNALGSWRMVRSDGLSPDFADRVIDSFGDTPPPAQTTFSEALAIADVDTHPMLEGRRPLYRDEGIRSMLVCPMRLGTARTGTLVFYDRTAHTFSDIDVETAQALANLAAAALTTAGLYEEQQAQRRIAEAGRRQSALLAEAAAILSRSLDFEQTVTAVARLAVPSFADWCAVDILDAEGQLKRLSVAHVDPAKVEYARTLEQRYPPDPKAPGGVRDVIRTGQSAMLSTIPPELIAARAQDEEHLRILKELALSSYMCVPLTSPRGVLGAMTFVFAESGRHYTDDDLALAQNLATRAALSIENAMAYTRANDANRVKDEFLATLSHELRTPLNAILGYAQMLSMGVLKGARQSKALAVLTRNADSLSRIIDDVLDVSRITSGKLRLNVRPIALDDILRNAVATIQPAADARGVSVQITIDTGAGLVSADPDRLRQVVSNLLSNAVKFTPRGGHVQARLERQTASVDVVVEDDGQGIEPAFLPHIFERFRQADARFAREHGGLGLGLAIVRELVELHGGTVSASSLGPGKGATFRVCLPPLVMQEDKEGIGEGQDLPTLPGGMTHALADRLRGTRILAVDDEGDAQDLVRVILESAGAEVTVANSGALVLDLMQAPIFDALIADLGMPQMDGLELIRRVRETLPSPVNRIPAVALTAYARSEDRETALKAGFDVHIPKPINPTEVVTAIAALLER